MSGSASCWCKSKLFLLHPPRLPILPRCHSFRFLKHPRKIISIAHPAFLPNLFYGEVGEAEKLFGVCDADLDQIVIDRGAELVFEAAGQIKLVNKILR